jgi:3,4-dihydroxy 2-butanone 4-phosphate synthase/GTP cyclohydrolase II
MTDFQFDTIEAALQDLAAGRSIVVVDDENRENEGDVICAAQFATPDNINFMAVEARGLICLAMTGERLDQLDFTPDGQPQRLRRRKRTNRLHRQY